MPGSRAATRPCPIGDTGDQRLAAFPLGSRSREPTATPLLSGRLYFVSGERRRESFARPEQNSARRRRVTRRPAQHARARPVARVSVGSVLRTMVFAAVLCGVAACESSQASPGASPSSSRSAASSTEAGSGSVQYRLPFTTDTMTSIGSYAIHAGNFGSVDDGHNAAITFTEASRSVKASLDFLVAADTAVHPVASKARRPDRCPD